MRHNKTESIEEVVNNYLKALGIDKKMKEARIINLWEETVGISVAKVTTNIFVNNGTLFVKIRSSVVRNELMMLKEGIMKSLNNRVQENIIKDIVIR